MHVMGWIGVLISLAGIYLLWQARRGILYWLEFYFRVFRSEFTRRAGLARDAQHVAAGVSLDAAGRPDTPAAANHSRRKNTALLVASGFGLMVLGQVLFLLDLAL